MSLNVQNFNLHTVYLTLMMALAENIQAVQKQIPPSVQLIAVSKYAPIELIQKAYNLGLKHFGEGRVQEALIKKAALKNLDDTTWHLTGHLQKNKVRAALQVFDWIHSVDSLELLERINKIAEEEHKRPKVLLQIKLVPDENKIGFAPDKLIEVLQFASKLEYIELKGLMTILPQVAKEEIAYTLFSKLFALKQKANELLQSNIHLEHLSMGMSEDYLQAIKAGTTMVRLGKAIFNI